MRAEVVNAYPTPAPSSARSSTPRSPSRTAGEYALCWRFFFGQPRDLSPPADAPYAPPAEPLRFAGVRALVVTVGAASPTGTAVGCVSNVTVRGAFAAAVPDAWPVCDFGGRSGTPSPSTQLASCARRPRRMRWARSPSASASPTRAAAPSEAWWCCRPFVLHLRRRHHRGLLPGGRLVQPAGQRLAVGQGLCRPRRAVVPLRRRVGGRARRRRRRRLLGRLREACVSNSVKEESATYALEFSPNGQCWPPTSSSATSFVTYNALVATVEPAGAPAGAAVWLTVKGEGFVALAGGLCNYTRDDGTVQQAPVSTISATEVRCEPPRAWAPGRSRCSSTARRRCPSS